jgi:sugar lactone lactonase YvrE
MRARGSGGQDHREHDEGERMQVTGFADGFHLVETPRWRAGRLWVSDMWDHTVWSFGLDGDRRLVHRFDDDEDPGGLGWMPDGSLLVVGMEGRVVYRFDGAGDGPPVVHADLSGLAPWQCNDMAVAPDGTAYVSQFGWDVWGHTTPYSLTRLMRVAPDGTATVAADELSSPNGISIRDDGRTVVVAESGASALTAFRVADDGELVDRTTLAVLAPVDGLTVAPPDGICADVDGGIWLAEPIGRRVLRVGPDGAVTDELAFDDHPLAVCLGGDDRRTLFVCVTGQHDKPNRRPEPLARIDTLRVDVPGTGVP